MTYFALPQIPIIRIFGTDADGIKTCMHVHGVLPYLYIPYNGGDGDDADRFTYQVATSLDKALNISLGQSNSNAEHIFKVLHVKAMYVNFSINRNKIIIIITFF